MAWKNRSSLRSSGSYSSALAAHAPSRPPCRLNAWSPVQRAGPSAYLLARALTAAAGLRSTPPPDWFTAEDRQMLTATEAALAADKLQEAAGHLAILSSRLEERGKKTADVLPIVMPDLATYVVAAYFAPVLLGLLGLVLLLLLLTP